MSIFQTFSQAVHTQFKAMSANELFVVDFPKDDLYEAYLSAFPDGTNPVFRERTEHDCSCCRNFVKNIGNVVAIKDGQVITVWDNFKDLPHPYDIVAATLAALIKTSKVASIFRSSEHSYGAESSVELLADGTTRRWNHFFGAVSNKHHNKEAGPVVGEYSTGVGVFKRGFDELKPEAFATVLDLISSNNLYKGQDFLHSIAAFQKAQQEYLKLDNTGKSLYIWANGGSNITRFRNTAIGTLLVDLSEDTPLEAAVKSFEAKVAPTNYKRPNALITQSMVNDAMKTINDLGLEEALERRFATIEDVSVNDILFVDNAVRGKMKGGVADLLANSVVPTKVTAEKAQEITVEEFLGNIVPKAKSMAVQVKNTHQANFVSITAPVHRSNGDIFKWDNNFAWSYDGNVTDSIKERVKSQGGITEAAMRVSLAWFNKDDLDIHVIEPNGHEIAFPNKGIRSRNTGMLDVDMNAYGPHSDTEPVENVVWTSPGDGVYKVNVHNYNQRTTTNQGFTLEIESQGSLHQYTCRTSPRSGMMNAAIKLHVKAGAVIKIETADGVEGGGFTQEKWDVQTEKFTRVDTLMLSPNHWGDNKAGAKHVLFMLEGCHNPLPTRGIYNEFLAPALEKHRKVFEVLGNKTMCQPAQNQLSGVGFTSARGDSVLVKVDDKKLYIVKF